MASTFQNGENLGSIRTTLNGNAEQINTLAADINTLSFDASLYSESYQTVLANSSWTYTTGTDNTITIGTIINTRSEGFIYRVASPSATDQNLTTSGGVKLYVVPNFGFLDARAFGVITDGNDSSVTFDNAIKAALASNVPLKLPVGQIKLNSIPTSTYVIPANQTLRIFSDGATEIYNNTSTGTISFSTTNPGVSYKLSSDAAIGATSINVTGTTGLQVNDALKIYTNTKVESVYGYPKACVRRIKSISGNTIYLDQLLDFFFTTSEIIGIYFGRPGRFESDNISYRTNRNPAYTGGSIFLFKNFLSGLITNGNVTATSFGQAGEYTNGIQVTDCDNFIFDHFNFIDTYYAPMITCGRNAQIKNCYATGVRHLDANSWAQDILYENITGNNTDGIIQCHPCIRPVFRNVKCQSSYNSIDLRGVGEIVENCQLTTSTPGTMTNSALINTAYEQWAMGYTRRVSNLEAPGCAISSGKQGKFIVEGGTIGRIWRGTYYYPSTEVFASPDTVLTSMLVNFNAINSGVPTSDMARKNGRGNINSVNPIYEYRTKWRSALITGVSLANPCVITSPRHGYATGNQVTISSVVGTTQLNGNTYTITVINANSYSLNGVNSSGYTAYVSGGLSRIVASIKDVTNITNANPAVFTVASHGYSAGDILWFNGTGGNTQYNDAVYTVTVINPNSYYLDYTNGTAFSSWTSGIVSRETISNDVLIENATKTNPVAITSSGLHGYTTGKQVIIAGVVGMTQLNGNTYTITVIDDYTYSLNGIDGTSFSAYVSGGVSYDTPKTISNITQTDPVVVTSTGHGYSTSDYVLISEVNGMTQVNNSVSSITVIDDNNYSLNGRNGTTFSAYVSGGITRQVVPTSVSITSITSTNPAVVNSTGHGYQTGDTIVLGRAVNGMSNLNRVYVKVTNPTTNTFEITYPNGTAIDTTTFGTYVSGGKVCLQELVITVDAGQAPGTGYGFGPLKVTVDLSKGLSSSARYYRFDFKFRMYQGDTGNINTDENAGKVKVVTYATNGHDLKEYGYDWYFNGSGYLGVSSPIVSNQNGLCTLTYIDRINHGYSDVVAEGEAGWTGSNYATLAGARYYQSYAFEVDTGSTSYPLFGANFDFEIYS